MEEIEHTLQEYGFQIGERLGGHLVMERYLMGYPCQRVILPEDPSQEKAKFIEVGFEQERNERWGNHPTKPVWTDVSIMEHVQKDFDWWLDSTDEVHQLMAVVGIVKEKE